MLSSAHLSAGVLLLAVGAATAQRLTGIPAPHFICPENNGRFPDPEQCDKFYLCKKGEAEEILCPEGLLFDFKVRNREKCVLPHNVDCGDRTYVQPRTEGIDDRCDKANGIFDHPDPFKCDQYITCDNGIAFEMPCNAPLQFDVFNGGCRRKEELSEFAKICEEPEPSEEEDGFVCPGKEAIGPQNLVQPHPILPDPSDCQFYYTCFNGKDPHRFGCSEGMAFDVNTQQCKKAEDVPDCACWYSCEGAPCDECLPNCTCPTK